MTTVVFDRIGELVTNDLAHGGTARCPPRRGGRGRGRPGGLGRDRPRKRLRPTTASTSRVRPCSPASSTATRTSSSPATGPRSSPPGWRVVPTRPAASRRRWRRPGRPRTRHLAANVARLVAEMARQGTTTVEIKSGYGLTTYDEARALGDGATVHRGDDVPGGARRAARVRRGRRGVRRPGHRTDARGRGTACALDRRVLRARRVRRGPGAHDPCGRPRGGTAAAGARQPARAWPGHHRGVRGRGRLGRPLHVRQRGGRRQPRRRRRRRDAASRRRVLDPVALPGRACAARGRRHRRAGHRLQPRLLLHVVDAAVHRAGRPGDADEPRRGGLVGDGRGRGGAPARRRRPTPGGGPGRPDRAGGTVIPAPGLPPGRPARRMRPTSPAADR